MKINYSLTSLEYTFNHAIHDVIMTILLGITFSLALLGGFESIVQGQQGQINVISFKTPGA